MVLALRQSHKFDPVCYRLKNKGKMHFETVQSKGLDLWDIKSRTGRKIFKKKRGINTWSFECTSWLRIKVPISYFEECCLQAAEIRQNSSALKFLFIRGLLTFSLKDIMMWTWALKKHKDGQIIVGLWSLNISDHRSKKICWFFFVCIRWIWHPAPPCSLTPTAKSGAKKQTSKMHLELKSNEPHLEKQAQQ